MPPIVTSPPVTTLTSWMTFEIFVAYDKPWDEEFQDVPGIAGRGRSSFRWVLLTVGRYFANSAPWLDK